MLNNEEVHIRKWYFFEKDKHHGPYSQIELRRKFENQYHAKDILLWSEGMPEWQPLEEIPSLSLLFSLPVDSSLDFLEASDNSKKIITSNTSTVPSPGLKKNDLEDSNIESRFLRKNPSQSSFVTNPLSAQELPSLNQLILLKAKGHLSYIMRKFAFQYYRYQKTFIAILLATAFSLYYWGIRPHDIEDESLTLEQRREIFHTIKEPKNPDHPALTLVKVEAELENPYFYVATNLADDSLLTLVIEGIPDTLTDQFYFKMYSDLRVQNGFIRTPVLRQKNGKAVAQGEYRFQISCKECPEIKQGTKLPLYERSFFLGGKKDQNYDNKLKIYHLQLRRQAQSEIQDIRQISETLEKQLNDTTLEFEQNLRSNQKPKAVLLQEWKSFHNRWTHLQKQLDLLYNSWTPEHLTEKIFYGDLYAKLQTAAADIKNIHSKQDNYIQGNHREDQQEYEIASDISLVQSAIQQIRIKSNLTERLPASANGMPQRLTTEH